MGWFDEQIRERQRADGEVFSDSFEQIAGAVMGRHMSDALDDNREITTDAIGQILKYYHARAREVPSSLRNMNEVLEFLLRPYGIMRRTVHLDEGWYHDAVGAMLGTLKEDGSVVALIPDRVAGYWFRDRKTGERVRLNRKTAGLIEREAIAFYKPFPLKKLTMGGLIRYMAEQLVPSDIVMTLLAMLAVTLVGTQIPWINKQLFSDVLQSGSTRMLAGAAIFLIGVTVSSVLFGAVQGLAVARISTRMNISVSGAAMMRVLSLPPAFFRQYSSGELANRTSYISSLAQELVVTVMSTGLTSLFSLIYLFQVFHYAPALVVPAMVVTLLTLALTIVTVLLRMRITREQMELTSKESGMSYALITGIQKLRLAGAEKRAFARWGRLYARSAALQYNPPMFLKISGVLTLGVSLIGTMVMYYTAIRSHVSLSEYYAFNAAYGMINGAFMALAGIAATIGRVQPMLEMVRPILEAVPEISEDKQMVTRLGGSVEVSNVTFRYQENMPAVLDNFSLKIQSGQYVAIVGRTGCGKSTLVRILLGFEKPQKGAVFYDGRDLSRLDLKSLRRSIGTVMQDGKLFTGDIYSNIVLTAPWLTLGDAWAAAETAGVADDIRAMPMGMNTLISEGHGGISGGQRQRMLIARAIAPKPRILIFDEATSALDNVTQRQVSTALDRMQCTRIVIAHRLSTIRQCDRIVVLDQGHIVEDGTYEELIAQKGFFAELVARQRLEDQPA